MRGLAGVTAERVSLMLPVREVDVHGNSGVAVVQLWRQWLHRSEHRREDEQTRHESEQWTIPSREHATSIVRRRRFVKALEACGTGAL